MAASQVPEAWRSVMEPRGLHSARDLAAKASVAPSTITRLFAGESSPTEDTLTAVADALGISVLKVRRIAGRPVGESDPFVLPPEANRLDRRQRAAVVEIVRLLLEPESTMVVMSQGSGKTATIAHEAASRMRQGGRDRGDDPNA